jgi:hypothetical protein
MQTSHAVVALRYYAAGGPPACARSRPAWGSGKVDGVLARPGRLLLPRHLAHAAARRSSGRRRIAATFGGPKAPREGLHRDHCAGMAGERHPRQARARYTVVAEPITLRAVHLRVRELPDTWTVAFDRDEVEERARYRIALDLGCHPSDFDVTVEFPAVDLERRAD